MIKGDQGLLGFTLVELVMVIVIIGMLAAIVIPNFTLQREQAAIATTKANLESLRTAIAFYYAQEGSYYSLDTSLPPLRPLFDGSTGKIYMAEVPLETISSPPKTEIVLGFPTGVGGWSWDSATHVLLPNLTGYDANGMLYYNY